MKRFVYMFLCSAVFVLTGCGDKESTESKSAPVAKAPAKEAQVKQDNNTGLAKPSKDLVKSAYKMSYNFPVTAKEMDLLDNHLHEFVIYTQTGCHKPSDLYKEMANEAGGYDKVIDQAKTLEAKGEAMTLDTKTKEAYMSSALGHVANYVAKEILEGRKIVPIWACLDYEKRELPLEYYLAEIKYNNHIPMFPEEIDLLLQGFVVSALDVTHEMRMGAQYEEFYYSKVFEKYGNLNKIKVKGQSDKKKGALEVAGMPAFEHMEGMAAAATGLWYDDPRKHADKIMSPEYDFIQTVDHFALEELGWIYVNGGPEALDNAVTEYQESLKKGTALTQADLAAMAQALLNSSQDEEEGD